MDAFNIIQHFFTRFHCQHCDAVFQQDDIELIRQESEGVYIVNVFCHHCNTQNGVAMVGVETHDGLSNDDGDDLDGLQLSDVLEEPAHAHDLEFLGKRRRPTKQKYNDPELTKKERRRLSKYGPVSEDDVLDAHYFFQNLGSDWQHFIPANLKPVDPIDLDQAIRAETHQFQTASDTESPSS